MNYKINEGDFLEEHPGFIQDIIYPFQNGKGFIDIYAIHKTQLDKQKVRKAINLIIEKKRPKGEFVDGYKFQIELKKELGL